MASARVISCIFLYFCISFAKANKCVTYNFENDIDSHFFNDTGICDGMLQGMTTWSAGSYSSIAKESPHEKSASFVSPAATLSCGSTFLFPMTEGGTLELNIYIESSSTTDQISVIAMQYISGGSDVTIGSAVVSPLDVNFVSGWQTLRIVTLGSGDFEGYLSILGTQSATSVILLDSFRYIPPELDAETESSCTIYKDNIESVTLSTTETTTEYIHTSTGESTETTAAPTTITDTIVTDATATDTTIDEKTTTDAIETTVSPTTVFDTTITDTTLDDRITTEVAETTVLSTTVTDTTVTDTTSDEITTIDTTEINLLPTTVTDTTSDEITAIDTTETTVLPTTITDATIDDRTTTYATETTVLPTTIDDRTTTDAIETTVLPTTVTDTSIDDRTTIYATETTVLPTAITDATIDDRTTTDAIETTVLPTTVTDTSIDDRTTTDVTESTELPTTVTDTTIDDRTTTDATETTVLPTTEPGTTIDDRTTTDAIETTLSPTTTVETTVSPTTTIETTISPTTIIDTTFTDSSTTTVLSTTILPTTDNPTTETFIETTTETIDSTTQQFDEIEECVTINFENDFDVDFSSNNYLCNGYLPWQLDNYTSIDIGSPNQLSTAFMGPHESPSCISSFVFKMEPGGIVEANVYMEPVQTLDYIIIIAQRVTELDYDTVAGFVKYYPENEIFIPGWNVIRFTLLDLTSFDGYLLFFGSADGSSTVLVDSVRYIPPGTPAEDASCYIY